MGDIVEDRRIECRADRRALWAALSDTDRINRAIGFEKVEASKLSDESAARYLLHANVGGFPTEIEERPFEWTYLERLNVRRKMRSGPISTLELGFALEPSAGGSTQVDVRLAVGPRDPAFAAPLGGAAAQMMDTLVKEVQRIDAALVALGSPRVAPSADVLRDRELARALADLGKTDPPALVERLVKLVREGDDVEVSRIRPYELADVWKLPRRDVLALCLRAVRAGLLELRWEVVCPSCQTGTEAFVALSDLGEHGACQLCDLAFEIELDEAVEATFAPTKAVRTVDAGPYCIGGPARTPHVVAQAILPPKGSAELTAPDETGRFRVFVRGGRTVLVEVDAKGPAAIEIDANGENDQVVHKLAPRGVITVRTKAAVESHAKLERVAVTRQAATARDVTSMAAFRRDFSKDIVRPGTGLKVARVTIFFSDLTASTQLYSNVGDAAAFRLVQDHFDVVFGVIERHGGTIVKTIGDAVMSVFADEHEGLAASLEILREFEPFRRREAHHEQTHIKLGLYAGPCYVVTANGVLDYFGQTVNVAARLQGEAKSGELVVEADLAERAIAAGALERSAIVGRYDAKLKGVTDAIAVVRIVTAKI